MKNHIRIKANAAKSKFKVLIGAALFFMTLLVACNGNTKTGDTTASHDTSSTVTDRVDTTGSATKQP